MLRFLAENLKTSAKRKRKHRICPDKYRMSSLITSKKSILTRCNPYIYALFVSEVVTVAKVKLCHAQ